MEVSINDLSFKGQFKSDEEAKFFLKEISRAALASKKITGNKPVRRTRQLSLRPLIGGKTIEEFKMELHNSKRPEDKTILGIILTNLGQGPFIDDTELDQNFAGFTSICAEKVDGSSIHAYLSKTDESINALISAGNSNEYSGPVLKFESCDGKEITVFNFTTAACCNGFYRTYEVNSKHIIRKDKVVAGNVHSKMDLTDALAQQCLDNGFQVLGHRSVYYFINQKWYEFPRHHTGIYHGYPIGLPSNDAIINRIKKVFGEPPYSTLGYKFCTR